MFRKIAGTVSALLLGTLIATAEISPAVAAPEGGDTGWGKRSQVTSGFVLAG
jgi:hypothetical protein